MQRAVFHCLSMLIFLCFLFLYENIYILLVSPFSVVVSLTSYKTFNTSVDGHTIPSFMIIGGSRGATTTLYNNLFKHPQLVRGKRKEPIFFNKKRGTEEETFEEYTSNFPPTVPEGSMTGEGSARYLPNLYAPMNIKRLLPDTKFLVLLRDPVEMSHSYYQTYFKTKYSSFSQAIADSMQTLSVCLEMKPDKKYDSGVGAKLELLRDLKDAPLLSKCISSLEEENVLVSAIYAPQLRYWFRFFPRSQFYIATTEQFAENRGKVVNQIAEFLEIGSFERRQISALKDENVGSYTTTVQRDDRIVLQKFFSRYTRELFQLLNTTFAWSSMQEAS